MKKKVKLFSTIASLCLAVALMAFGVWAATSSAFKVTSKVSFTATDVYVQFTADNYKGATVEDALASVITTLTSSLPTFLTVHLYTKAITVPSSSISVNVSLS